MSFESSFTPSPPSSPNLDQKKPTAQSPISILDADTLRFLEQKGFDLISERRLEALNSDVIVLKARESGVTVISVHNDDRNKYFRLMVPTFPENDTGVFHKIEHAVLSGSTRIPVREPFSTVSRSVLFTEINASTGPDCTQYYAGSTDQASLEAMAGMHLDAVFRAELSEDVFKREHGYLRADPKTGAIKFGGIVHDEMIGVYASPNYWLWDAYRQGLFPNSAYTHQAGGNPLEMPKLTFEEFTDTYKRFYDPARMVCTLYGDSSLRQRIEFLSKELEGVKSTNSTVEQLKAIPSETLRSVELPYYTDVTDAAQLACKHEFTMNWKFPRLHDYQEDFEVNTLAMLLGSDEFSPLMQAHRQSGLTNIYNGASYHPWYGEEGFDISIGESSKPELTQSRQIILDTLAKLAKDGFEAETIEAVLNRVDYANRRYLTNPYRGSNLTQHLGSEMLYGRPDFDALSTKDRIQILKEKLAQGEKVFENLIQRYLINNNNRVELTCVPDPEMRTRWLKQQQDWVDAEVSRLGPQGVAAALSEAKRLEQRENLQDSPEALAKVCIAELPEKYRTEREIEVQAEDFLGSKIFYQPQPTQGLAHFSLCFDLNEIAPAKFPLVSLMASMLIRRGPASMSGAEFSQTVAQDSGGISATVRIIGDQSAPDPRTVEPKCMVVFNADAKPEHYGSTLKILSNVLLDPSYSDKQMLSYLVKEEISSLQQTRNTPQAMRREVGVELERDMSFSGNVGANLSLSATLTTLEKLNERINSDWPGVEVELKDLHAKIFSRTKLNASVTTEEESWIHIRPKLLTAIETLPEAEPTAVVTNTFSPTSKRVAVEKPLQNNFIGEALDLNDTALTRFQEHGVALVACRLLDDYLEREIRSKGGAYGARAHYDTRFAQVRFLSWQDPNISRSIDSFHRAGEYLRTEVSEDSLKRAKVAAINGFEAPKSAQALGQDGFLRVLSSYGASEVSKVRAQILDTSLDDLKRFAELMTKAQSQNPSLVVFGNKQNLDQAQAEGITFDQV